MSSTDASPSLRSIQLAGGGFAMLAIDQRESLRTMMATATGKVIHDDQLVEFKRATIEVLTPRASAVLIDKQYALRDGRPNVHPGCGLILAVDAFTQRPGGPVEDSGLDPSITLDVIRDVGADALKLLVLWTAGQSRQGRDDLVGRFTALAAEAGLPCILEGVVRPRTGVEWAASAERDEAIQQAAEEFAEARPDVYKAEVPGLGQLPAEELKRRARDLTAALSCPWVVLSSGVPASLFPDVVAAACAGGASGFLAGRALWQDALGQNTDAYLSGEGVARLTRLSDIVQSAIRPPLTDQ